MNSHTTDDFPSLESMVEPGSKRHLYFEVGETYLGHPVELPVTIIDGEGDGPRVFLSAAIHGDEVNGVKVLQKTAARFNPGDIDGTLVCLHVLNVPGYLAQQRYLPIYDQDLNRSFPGTEDGSTAARMAHAIYRQFICQCNYGVDFHTSTRDRLTLYHVRGDVDDEGVDRLTRAFGANLVISGAGSEDSLRRVATENGVPTITVEMGEAQRFQPALIQLALDGIESVLTELGLLTDGSTVESGFRKVIESGEESTWVRANHGGLVEMEWGPNPVVEAGEPICTISDHFSHEAHTVTAPFDGLLVGILANPRVLPGHPLFHLVETDESEHADIASAFQRVGFEGLSTFHWMGAVAERVADEVADENLDS